MVALPPDVVLPCGCYLTHHVEGGANVLQMAPCHIDCANLRDLLELAAAGDKPVERVVR